MAKIKTALVKTSKNGFKADLKTKTGLKDYITVQNKGIVWRTSQKVRLLCPWTRHLMGCFNL